MHKEYERIEKFIKENSQDNYYEVVFEHPMSFYEERVMMSGVTGYKKVLDAGCGYGQWSVALSKYNKEVVALDHSEYMLKCANNLKKHCGVTNLNFIHGDLHSTMESFDNMSFEAIWIWSTLMFLNRDHVLREFNRILKPGGVIFVGSKNSIGRVFYKIFHLGFKKLDFKAIKREFKNVFYGRRIDYINNYSMLSQLENVYEPYGFDVIAKDSEGFIDMELKGRKKPMFKPKFLFMRSNIEFILKKRD
ncbi:class I SAM-dependent methyltransferase [Francisella sp. 19X1-34]|uniref:class I SAM-dependent methyltransferase n=1 Tax=Francisella sp. 19X1-34 TaxID=3087177 RepID=UPI002E319855|nr:class I SAM-dependent methyltransferase [Francisella sp. 19X1-34]MED7787552.1 class I SAM-dependent methyltransferase [Francisella sp. 19X1-34]